MTIAGNDQRLPVHALEIDLGLSFSEDFPRDHDRSNREQEEQQLLQDFDSDHPSKLADDGSTASGR